MHQFRFELGEKINISISKTEGVVIALCRHIDTSDNFSVRYKDHDGDARESWFYERELEVPTTTPEPSTD